MADTSEHTHHSIDYIEIPVTDVAAAKAFYASAFGCSFNAYGPDYAGIKRLGGSGEVGGLRKEARRPLIFRVGAGFISKIQAVMNWVYGLQTKQIGAS